MDGKHIEHICPAGEDLAREWECRRLILISKEEGLTEYKGGLELIRMYDTLVVAF